MPGEYRCEQRGGLLVVPAPRCLRRSKRFGPALMELARKAAAPGPGAYSQVHPRRRAPRNSQDDSEGDSDKDAVGDSDEGEDR